jgi:hypothetical protein
MQLGPVAARSAVPTPPCRRLQATATRPAQVPLPVPLPEWRGVGVPPLRLLLLQLPALAEGVRRDLHWLQHYLRTAVG